MNTEIVKFEFNNQEVDFEQNEQTLMVNATQMAKIFGKQVNEFLSNDGTKSFLIECLKNGNSRFLGVEKEEDLVISKQKSGTWMHRVLALKFAAWLDPAFELWVYSTIDDLLFGRYRRMEESLKMAAARKNRIEELKNELRANEGSMFAELERLELEERQSAYVRSKEIKNQLELFRTIETITTP